MLCCGLDDVGIVPGKPSQTPVAKLTDALTKRLNTQIPAGEGWNVVVNHSGNSQMPLGSHDGEIINTRYAGLGQTDSGDSISGLLAADMDKKQVRRNIGNKRNSIIDNGAGQSFGSHIRNRDAITTRLPTSFRTPILTEIA